MEVSYYTEERLKLAEKKFLELADDRFISLENFQILIKARNTFIAERVFGICNKHETTRLSIDSFMQLVRSIVRSPVLEKLRLIFQIYDLNGDWKLEAGEIKEIIKNSMDENELYFTNEEIDILIGVLFNEIDIDNSKSIDFNEFYTQLKTRPGLIENLVINVENWFLPKPENKKSFQIKKLIPQCFKWSYIQNNYVNINSILIFFGINVILFVTRAMDFYDPINPNNYYMIARASARCLYFDASILIVTMFRKCITFLRSQGFSSILPLDDHIYFHQLIGYFVVIHGSTHATCHIIDFTLILPQQTNFTAIEYLFFPKATMNFGFIKGYACITGWILLGTLFIIALFARSHAFDAIFYFTHFLFIIWYITLILHAPDFWIWFTVPGTIYVLEGLRRIIWTSKKSLGKTYVHEGKLLPSRVIHLAIKRPEHFNYNAGDYVSVNIPLISTTEWHPFTISSAPELRDVIWLHIRAVGPWTNRLYKYFLDKVPINTFNNPKEFHKRSPVFVFLENNLNDTRMRVRVENEPSTSRENSAADLDNAGSQEQLIENVENEPLVYSDESGTVEPRYSQVDFAIEIA